MERIEYINAGAGSGKTYRLTHTLSRLLSSTDPEQHVSPSEVIVATFTRAAAAEVKGRARQVLLENGNIEDAARLDSAAIGTVHSVCQSFLDRYWYAIGATPGRSVISEEDRTLYRNQSLSFLLSDDRFDAQRKAIDRFYTEFLPKKKVGNADKPDPEFWAEYLNTAINKISYYEITDMDGSRRESHETISGLFPLTDQPDMTRYQEIRDRYLSEASRFITETESSGDDIKASEKAIGSLRKDVRSCRMRGKEMTYSNLLSLYGWISKEQPWMSSWEQDTRQLSTWLKSSFYGQIIKDCTDAIFVLAQAWLGEYDRFKKSHGVIDYDDMEKDFLRLLDNESVAEEIARNYKLVMVDEFQDCNPVQLKIFDRLSHIVARHSPLAQSSIWVGDPKQAIYGFRGSDTGLINRVASRFPQELRMQDDHGLLRDTLGESFRSRPSLVSLVNGIFSKEGFFPEMTQLKAHLKEHEGMLPSFAHLHFEDEKNDEYFVNLARHIKKMVQNQEHRFVPKDETELRVVQYGDIAILCKTKEHVKAAAKSLRAQGVPVSSPETDIFERAETQLVLSVLRLSEHPGSAHEWASVLHLYGDWSTDDILRSRLGYLEQKAEDEKDAWISGIGAVSPVGTVLRHISSLPLNEKISSIILELGLKDMVSKWGDGDVRRRNLLTLQSAAAQYCTRCQCLDLPTSALSFSKYLQEAQLKSDADLGSDTVKVCTYHKSKGLEWPVVFLASLKNIDLQTDKLIEREFWGVHEVQLDSSRGQLLPDYRLHIFPAPVSSKSAFFNSREEILQSPMYDQAKNRVKGELMRLMYVGMTRARDYLFLLTHQKSPWSWLTSIGMDMDSAGIPCCNIDPVTPVAPKEPKAPKSANPRPVTLQKYQQECQEYQRALAAYEKALEEAEARRNEASAPQHYRLRALPELEDPDTDDRYVLPSRLSRREAKDARLSGLIPISKGFSIKSNGTPLEEEQAEDGFRASVFGTCVHHVFAACPLSGCNPSEEEREKYVLTATSIIHNHGLDHVIPDSASLVDSLYDLYSWLKKEYGPAESISHELPFSFPLEGGHVMKGEIDLVWQTADGSVIVDFKNHQGDIREVIDPKDSAYAGSHYAAQLRAYRNILESAGKKVLATILYYDLQGDLLIID